MKLEIRLKIELRHGIFELFNYIRNLESERLNKELAETKDSYMQTEGS